MSEIKMENLHFAYPSGEDVLKGLDFTIDTRSTAIIGQNGAGKTTFVKLLKGLLRPTAGTIWLDGADTASMRAAELASYIGLVFQNPDDQIFKASVQDEVMFGPLQIGMGREEARRAAEEAMEWMGLTGLEAQNPYDMGLSVRKLIAIASILAMHTQVLILDEPTIAQDRAGRARIRDMIHRLQKEGRQVITIIHDMDFVAEVFERVIVFAEGRILLDGSAKEVFSNGAVLEAAALEQPAVTRLCRALGYEGTYLTVAEAAEQIRIRRGQK